MEWKKHQIFLAEHFLQRPELKSGEDRFSILRNGNRGGMAAHLFFYPLAGERALRFSVSANAAPGTAPECFGAIVNWLDPKEKMLARDYLHRKGDESFERVLPVPAGAAAFSLELFSRWTSDDVVFSKPDVESAEWKSRPVRLLTTKVNPPQGSSREENLKLIAGLLERIGTEVEKPDLILLPENLNTRNAVLSAAERVQSADGEYFHLLSRFARKWKTWLVTTFAEIQDGECFNTALLIGRDGTLEGKYRKVHLTLSESEAGFLPGDSFPVFELDFGRIGIATCWDNWFPESVRMLRLNGAEIVLFPLAGDGEPLHWEHVWRTRAMDNGVYLAASVSQGESGIPVPARVIRPDGSVCAETTENPGYAVADLDLSERFLTYWLSVGPALGEGPSLYQMERRVECYHPSAEIQGKESNTHERG